MTLIPRTRSGIRCTTPCHRHPDQTLTGICPSCLRERLDSAAPTAASPELRRCRSVVSISKCEPSSGVLNAPRRKSCDVVSPRSSLCALFDVDDLECGSAKVESKNVGTNAGLSKVTYTVIESEKEHRGDQIRVSSDAFGEKSNAESESVEFKTMKEYIDLEFQHKPKKKPKDSRGIAGNLLMGAASVFTRKLRNWRQRNTSNHPDKTKKHENNSCNEGNLKLFRDGRRSCEIEPRFSVDDQFEEPRASWDGYMVARTIPRLAPMFSAVDNGVMGSVNKFENRRFSVDGLTMHSIVEEESSSGASGSGQSNSDSSWSSSVPSFGKKAIDHRAPPANVKLVITQKELKDWHLSSCRDEGSQKFGSSKSPAATETAGNLNSSAKKSIRWRNVIGLGPKSTSERVCETLGGNVIDEGSQKHERDDAWKLTRSTSVVGPRNSCDVAESNYRRSVDNAGGFGFKGIEDFKVERNPSAKYCPGELGDGLTPFYMTPLRSLKHCKSGKFNVINPDSKAGNALQLN